MERSVTIHHLPPNEAETLDAVLMDNERLALALEVCSHVLHREDPPDSWLHAAQQAASAVHDPTWRIAYVDDDDPELRRLAERTVVME